MKEKKIYLITGSPGAGKSTYAKNNAGDNDIIFDLDEINKALGGGLHEKEPRGLDVALAMRDAAITALAKRAGGWSNAYFISASPDRDEINKLCERLGAEEIEIKSTLEECIEHIEQDETRPDKPGDIGLAENWHRKTESKMTTKEQFEKWFDTNFL